MAVAFFTEEKERSLLAEKEHMTISEKEEESPRKTKSSMVKKYYTRERYTQQNHENFQRAYASYSDSQIEAPQNYRQRLSSPSVIAASCNTRDPQNPSSEPMLYDEDKEKSLLDHLPQKPRSTLKTFFRKTRNRVSRAESETKSPPNPNSSSLPSCLMENTSHKRPAVSQGSGKSKKAKEKAAPLPLRAPRETPEWLREMKEAVDPRLIFEKPLSASDVKSDQSRLLIPFKKLLRNDFLTPSESRAIENNGVETMIVNQMSKMWGLRFKRWVMKKKNSGKGTLNYALNKGWNDVVKDNRLKAKDKISLWTFRCCGRLCFALETE